MFRKILLIIVFAIGLAQCRPDRIDEENVSNDASIQLTFSESTILFDTIFTSIGSTTKWLRVYNPSSKTIKISNISIKGPDNAFFRINVDGEAGDIVKDVYLAGKDSLFVFVDVTIDPNSGQTLPFLVEGNIEFVTNGNIQNVNLIAYGQEAFFITPNRFPENLPPYRIVMDGINSDTTWTNELPIVVYGYAVVDSSQLLNIEAGTQIHFHANSGLWVYRYGQIKVNGSLEDPVVFQGDRLDGYQDISGSWDRIWINDGATGKDNDFNYAVIKNSFIGIQAEYKPFNGFKDGISGNQINLTNTVIDNTKFAGIYTLNQKIVGENLLVSNSGNSNLIASGGGLYVFRHSTFANYWRGSIRNTPAVYLSQLYFDFEAQAYREDSMIINFENTIIYGSQESEFNIEEEVDPGEKINFTMSATLFKSNIDVDEYGTYDPDTILNPSNQEIFEDPYGGVFKLDPASPAISAGRDAFVSGNTLTDLEGKTRSTVDPDMGAIEFE